MRHEDAMKDVRLRDIVFTMAVTLIPTILAVLGILSIR